MTNPARRARLVVVALGCCLEACGAPAPARQPTGLPYDSIATERVAPGIVHRRLVANGGPFTIHVLEVDLRRSDITIAAMHALDSLRGRERTSAMVARRVAAGTPVLA